MGFRGGKLAMADIDAAESWLLLQSYDFWQLTRYALARTMRVGLVNGLRRPNTSTQKN